MPTKGTKSRITRAKKSTKKKAIAASTNAKSDKKSEPSYVVAKPKSASYKSTFGISTHTLHPDHPANQGLTKNLADKINSAALSAQAEASIYKDDLAKRMSQDEAMDHLKLIESIAHTASIAGSFRRGALFGNDIDIVIKEPIERVISQLSSLGYIKHTFSAGQHKFSGVVKHPMYAMHRHLDIVMTDDRSYPFAMLYFTGSKRHNIIMRLKAKKLGLKLNEYGLFRGTSMIPGITSEQDIFTTLGVEYKEPSERN